MKSGRARLASTLVPALLAAGLSAPAHAQEGVIRIGVTIQLTDPTTYAIGQIIADEFAAMSKAGGINGRKIETILLNDECKPDKGVANANRLIHQDKVHMVLGSNCSSVTLPILDILTKQGVPLLNPQSTNDTITQKGSEWIFRVAVSERFYRGMRAKYAAEHAGKQIAYLYTNDAAGISFAVGLIDHMKDVYKVEPVFRTQMQEADLDFRPALLKMKSLNPDAIALGGQGEALARMLQQSYEVGIPRKVLRIGPPAADELPVPTLAGDASVGLVYAGAFSYVEERPEVQALRNLVKTKYKLNEPNFSLALTYDTVFVAKRALESAKLKLTDASLAEDRIAIRDALASVRDYKGTVPGTISFCADPTPQCRDGNRTALMLTYTKGGPQFAVKVISQETLSADTGLKP